MSTPEWRKKHAKERVAYTIKWKLNNPEKVRITEKAYVKRRRANDPEYRKTSNERVKMYKAKNRLVFQEFKNTLKCERCPENTPCCLDFHHLDPSKKDVSISRLSSKSIKRIMKEVEKCIVLCSNCHKKEHKRLSLAKGLIKSTSNGSLYPTTHGRLNPKL